MRYIYYIFFIACALSAGVIFFTQHKPLDSSSSDYVIAINDREISIDEFKKRLAAHPPHITNEEYIDSIIMKELLIQEAKRLGIDKEESFRSSIQDFYEQSLTKILLERKYNELEKTPSGWKTDKYLDLLGRTISLTLIDNISASGSDSSHSEQEGQSTLTDLFDNLSTDLKMNILSLKPGERSGPLTIFGKDLIIQLNSIGEKSKSAVHDLKRSDIDKMIDEYNKELTLQRWLDKLRKKASIRINRTLMAKVLL